MVTVDTEERFDMRHRRTRDCGERDVEGTTRVGERSPGRDQLDAGIADVKRVRTKGSREPDRRGGQENDEQQLNGELSGNRRASYDFPPDIDARKS